MGKTGSRLPPFEKGNYPYYVVWKEGGVIYAKKGLTGEIKFADTDFATVMNNAIDEMNAHTAHGGKIYLMPYPTAGKPYTVTSTITMRGSMVIETPTKNSGRLKLADGANTDVIEIPGGVITGLRNLKIEGNNDNNTSGNCVVISGGTEYFMENVEARSASGSGLEITPAQDTTYVVFDNLWILDNEGQGVIVRPSNYTISDFRIINSALKSLSGVYALMIKNGAVVNDLQISNTLFHGYNGLSVKEGQNQKINNCLFDMKTTGSYAVKMTPGTATDFYTLLMNNYFINQNVHIGSNADYVVVGNNRYQNATVEVESGGNLNGVVGWKYENVEKLFFGGDKDFSLYYDSGADQFVVYDNINDVELFRFNKNGIVEAPQGVETGTLETETDPGAITLADVPVSSTPSAGTEQSYTFALDATNLLKIYAEADGAGGIQNPRVKTLDIPLQLSGRDSAPSSPSVGDVVLASPTWDPDGDGNGETVIYDGTAWQEMADMPNYT